MYLFYVLTSHRQPLKDLIEVQNKATELLSKIKTTFKWMLSTHTNIFL